MSVYSLLEDARRLPRRVVVIDVFRSSNTVIELLSRGAARVIPVAEIGEARAIVAANPGCLLLGERNGERLPGCDGDNSPTQQLPGLDGATVALTTSGGTRCIASCGRGREIWMGSFANGRALVHRLLAEGADDVGFWAVGVAGEISAAEDELCAAWMDGLWRGSRQEAEPLRERLLGCDGAGRLRDLGQHADLEYCCLFDSRTVTPKLVRGDDDLWGFVP